jgi:hypothetical protein
VDLGWVQFDRLRALSAARWVWIAAIWLAGIPLTIVAWGSSAGWDSSSAPPCSC